jgi:hypothetical protein
LHACQTGRYSRGRCQAAPCQQGYVRCPFQFCRLVTAAAANRNRNRRWDGAGGP